MVSLPLLREDRWRSRPAAAPMGRPYRRFRQGWRDWCSGRGWGLALVGTVGVVAAGAAPAIAQTPPSDLCPVPALERVQQHRVAAGETLTAIAAAYDLLPATLLAMNPRAQNGVTPGQTLRIPPFNGTEVQGTGGRSWTDLAAQYQVRADVLFEINGCLPTPPDRLFVPGVSAFTGSVRAESPAATAHPLTTYPLGTILPLVVGYGWQPHPTEARLVFNSGVTLAATQPVTVQAAGAGTVAYAGPHEGLGLLVVINHDQGFQTRYGQVGNVQVAAGDRVPAGGAIAQLNPTADTPAYLYFEVRTNSDLGWVARNPGDYLPELAVR